MSPLLNRRDLLRAMAAGAALSTQPLNAVAPLRSVAIVGAGMAGVSLAWLLDGVCDVTLLEARESIGGNVQSIETELDGHRFVVDMGAQYFHPGPYPAYVALLEQLGLYGTAAGPSATHPFTASITLTAAGAPTPRFVSPVLPERWWPFIAPWNFAGLWAFGLGFVAAAYREQQNQGWDLTLEEWLPTLGLAREQWEGMAPSSTAMYRARIAKRRCGSPR